MNRFLLLLLLLAPIVLQAQFPAPCDKQRACTHNAVQISVTSGRGAQYIDIEGQPIRDRQPALTVEMWVKAEKQAGKRVFLGGLWGPAQDNNDVWVLYLDPQDNLVFEVNGDGTKLGSADNTVAKVEASGIYGRWVHVAAVFDGASESTWLYIDGLLAVGPVKNIAYPTRYLRPLERRDLATQIGSCNGLSDNDILYRTFKGLIDEVRIWNRALTADQIRCQMSSSLAGNESGLQVYYRFNEDLDNVMPVCDATGNSYRGLLRSGATNKRNDRTRASTVVFAPAAVQDTIRCDSARIYTFQLSDTSFCGSSGRVRMRGPNAALYKITSPTNITLTQNQPVTVTIEFTGSIVGAFRDTLEWLSNDRCGVTRRMIFNMVRLTELSYSRSRIEYDSLYVGCLDKTYIDSLLIICNNSAEIGTPRNLTINGMTFKDPRHWQVSGKSFPRVLSPGACDTFVIRCHVQDTTGIYDDTLRVLSDDRCPGAGMIPLQGTSQEVIRIMNPGGTRRITTINFNATCPEMLSSPVYYVWQNPTAGPITVDTIIVPPDFTHYRMRFPVTLQPATGYDRIAIRFKPRSPGQVRDSVIIRTKIKGCLVEQKIYVNGRGYDNKVQWTSSSTDYGDVVVGQQRTIQISATNTGIDTLRVSVYLEQGEAFVLLSGTNRVILPGASVNIPVTFRPTQAQVYLDRLCLFEQRCYTVDCINLRGRGVNEIYRFEPPVAELNGIVACRSGVDSIIVHNITDQAQTMLNMRFLDASGKFTLIDPNPLPSQATIPPRGRYTISYNYAPNDVTRDRADRAYFQYETPANTQWQAQIIATSVSPRLYLTDLVEFGTLEVGDVKRDSMFVENASQLPIFVDSVSAPPGFRIAGTSRTLPLTLHPRDSFLLWVEFVPTVAQNYVGEVRAHAEDPCKITGKGQVRGRGVIIKLEAALSLINFSYVRPCECTERKMPLLNASLINEMIVDSLYINDGGVASATPQFFTWTSIMSPNGTSPFTIPPNSKDTVTIRFCPRSPSEDQYINCEALLNIKARGAGWAQRMETYLVGRRAMTFRPSVNLAVFPPTRVDTLSPPRSIVLNLPDHRTNPHQDTVVIDSITFEPNDRVFEVVQPTVLPHAISPGDSLNIIVKIRPRAPRFYEARMILHISKPCALKDTTVLVRGSGFAPAFGLDLAFNLTRTLPDTFRMISCDTLVVPLYSSRQVPASVVDIMFRLGYDTTQLRFLDLLSPLLSQTCSNPTGTVSFTPTVIDVSSPYGGRFVTCKNFCNVDSINPFGYARFVTANNNRTSTPLTLDSIRFDTEDIIFFNIVAGNDNAHVISVKSEMEFTSGADFDSVRVLDCADRSVTVYNVGDVEHELSSLVELPPTVSFVSSMPPLGSIIQPGDSALIVLRYCPRRDTTMDGHVVGVSLSPCDVRDTAALYGSGFVPDFPLRFAAIQNFWRVDPISAGLGDSILIPIMIDSNISAEYQGIVYWLNGLRFDVEMEYDPRALKFLELVSAIDTAVTITYKHGLLHLAFADVDTVRAGPVAVMRFLVTVPEIQKHTIIVRPGYFNTDSLFFLNILAEEGQTPFEGSGRCNITVLKYSTVGTPKMSVTPNPVSERARISFRIQETVPVFIDIVDATGAIVAVLMDGRQAYAGGEYVVGFDAQQFPSGIYNVRLSAGVFSATSPLLIIR